MILHLDLDCFFVGASLIKHPELKNKEVAVVGSGEKDIFGDEATLGNVILSANYPARKFGVKSAMSLKQAQKLCPKLIVLPSEFLLYKKLSKQVFKILYSYTPDIQQFSIDEFFMDLRGIDAINNPLKFAKNLQDRILKELGLACSIGINQNKYVAKFCTTLSKPFGILMCKNGEFSTKYGQYPIKSFPNVGKKMADFLHSKGIYSINEALKSKFIFDNMGKAYEKIYFNISENPTKELDLSRKRKSLGISRTFKALKDRDEIKRRILIVCRYLSFDILKLGLHPQTFELKIKYENKTAKTKSKSVHCEFSEPMLDALCMELFDDIDIYVDNKINFISLNCSNLVDKNNIQKNLFSEIERTKKTQIDKTIQSIREKFGVDSLKIAKEIK